MKNTFILALVLICTYATSFAQCKAPIAAKTAFDQKFPNASKVKWERERGHQFEANFEWNGMQHSANFSKTGEWLETETAITFDQLPEKVKAAFHASHNGAKVKEVSKIEFSETVTKYEIEFKKGICTRELFYTSDGDEAKE